MRNINIEVQVLRDFTIHSQQYVSSRCLESLLNT